MVIEVKSTPTQQRAQALGIMVELVKTDPVATGQSHDATRFVKFITDGAEAIRAYLYREE